MLLKNDLYQIISSEKSEDSCTYTLRITDKHPLFKGHFPGSPVLPGVCILQIFKELAEENLSTEKPLVYSEIKQCKFVTPVAMNQPATILVTFTLRQEENAWNISATMKSEIAIHTTLKAVLTTRQ